MLAKMYLLDWKGRVSRTRFVAYHSYEWEHLVALGYITDTVISFGKD